MKKSDGSLNKTEVKKIAVVCPKCSSENIKKNGFFMVDEVRVQKYFCIDCLSHFSDKTDHVEVNEKRPELNQAIIDLFMKGYTQKAIAEELGCSKRTVQVKLKKYLKA